MKRSSLILLFAAVVIWSCNTNEEADKKNTSHATASEQDSHSHEEKKKLSLNDGNKWKADSSTNSNVRNLLITVNKFNEGNDKTLAGYQAAAVSLQGGMEKMIKECRMKGAEHDALHQWLEPLVQQVSSFQKSTTEEQAGKIFHVIHEQLNLYTSYFE